MNIDLSGIQPVSGLQPIRFETGENTHLGLLWFSFGGKEAAVRVDLGKLMGPARDGQPPDERWPLIFVDDYKEAETGREALVEAHPQIRATLRPALLD